MLSPGRTLIAFFPYFALRSLDRAPLASPDFVEYLAAWNCRCLTFEGFDDHFSSFNTTRTLFYTIIVARFAILGHLSAASAATGPLMSVPFSSPSGVIITAALSSNITL